MKARNLNAEMMRVRAVLTAPWTEAEFATMAAQAAARVPDVPPVQSAAEPEPLGVRVNEPSC